MTRERRTLDLEAAIAGLVDVTDAGRLKLRVVALGWATVDTARASTELAEFGPFRPARDDPILGASCAVGGSMDICLTILEPVTEGRLAATLARHDEGPAVLWLSGHPRADGPAAIRLSTAVLGPFGDERLLLGGPLGGPHILVLHAPPGTIER